MSLRGPDRKLAGMTPSDTMPNAAPDPGIYHGRDRSRDPESRPGRPGGADPRHRYMYQKNADAGVAVDRGPGAEGASLSGAGAGAGADVGPDCGVDVGEVLRGLRRRADLSQRELAARAGVPVSTVARIESGVSANPAFRTVERLVRAAGGTVQFEVVPAGDAVGEQMGERRAGDAPGFGAGDGPRDRAGRRYPAHLDTREVFDAKDWGGAWWAHWYPLPRERWPVAVPAHTYDLDRGERDRRRRRDRVAAQAVIRPVGGLPANRWQWVAESPDGDVVGELRAHLRGDPGGVRDVVLDGIVVAPAYRRTGIGRRLMVALVAQTRAASGGRVLAVAETGESNQFLAGCGFRPAADRSVRWWLGLPAVS